MRPLNKRVRYKLSNDLSDTIKGAFPSLFNGRWRYGDMYESDGKLFVLVKTKDHYGVVRFSDVVVQDDVSKGSEVKKASFFGNVGGFDDKK